MRTPEPIEFLKLLRTSRRRPSEAARLAKLKAVVRHAYDRVPFYRERFRAAGVQPDDIRSLDDLRLLPVVTRRELMAAGVARFQEGYTGIPGLVHRHTSGSSGEPLDVVYSLEEGQRRRLREFRALLQAGFRPMDKLVVAGPEHPRPARLHRRLGLYRLEVIPGTLTPEQQARRLAAARPTILWSYASVLWAIYRQVEGRLRQLVQPRLLITSAEVFRQPWKQAILAELQCPHVELYGAMEVGRIAAPCPAGNGLHVEEDALILEILADEGIAPAGWAAITSLDQRVMPILRYRIGDFVKAREGNCPCGRESMWIDAPMGRDGDLVTMPSGRVCSNAALEFALRIVEGIRQFRFTQTSPSKIVLELATREPIGAEKLAELRRELSGLYPEPLEYEIRLVEEIRGEHLKFKIFVSSVDGAYR